ncbi:CLUMA_CG001600, isoform A [Clunio marinus]|uniref:CLUMA_CG001600, isoform A n=1 Tax=Clunio marinus TaxID=568069 RepID=A0A1J1HIA1_9DIPT|nr:CLUMA_CG001600, isoform A [Clunio marinus]
MDRNKIPTAFVWDYQNEYKEKTYTEYQKVFEMIRNNVIEMFFYMSIETLHAQIKFSKFRCLS